MTRDAFPAALARAYCEGLASCCRTIDEVVSQPDCITKIQAQIDTPTANSVGYDPKLGAECVTSFKQALAECSGLTAKLPACENMFFGTLAPGQACQDSDECAKPAQGDAYCSPPFNGSASVCEVTPGVVRGVLGEPCSSTCHYSGDDAELCASSWAPPPIDGQPVGDATCYTSDGLQCDVNGTCQPPVALGGTCRSSVSCAPDARCDFTAMQCVPLSETGAVCTMSSDCVAGLYCDYLAPASVCVPKKGDHQPCSRDEECVGYCLKPFDTGTGSCASGQKHFLPTPMFCQEFGTTQID